MYRKKVSLVTLATANVSPQWNIFMQQRLLMFLAIITGITLLLSSCSINPELDETAKLTRETLEKSNASALVITNALPTTITLSKIDLYLSKGSATTGDFTVQIRDSAGLYTIDSVRVPVSSITTGDAWNTFTFYQPVTLSRGAKYRIYVKRSDPHTLPGNTIYWRTSPGGTDTYPKGVNDVYPGWTLDYGFRTYSNGDLDQAQTQTGYGFFTGNNLFRWQEFVPDYPKVNVTSVDLNLGIGSATTGKLIVAIQNGADTLAKVSIYADSLPRGSFGWVKAKFPTPASLYRDQVYSIYVYRTAPHNYAANDYVNWMCSSGGFDSYPDGINDVYPSWILDYGFKTYSAVSGLDQQQTSIGYGFFTSNNVYRWQQFVPRHQ